MGDSPDKMTYTEQANKRQHCKRLTSFIRLCDYLITNTMHSLGKLKRLPQLCLNLTHTIFKCHFKPSIRYLPFWIDLESY